MLIKPGKKMLYHAALTGYPSSGKSEIGKMLADRAGYKHVSTDMIRGELLTGKSVFKLEPPEWNLIFSELQVRKHLYIREGKNVATDSCPHEKKSRRATLHVSPLLGDYLKEKNRELMRYLIVLYVDGKELERRNEGKGRTDQRSRDVMEWFGEAWREPPEDIMDEYGRVPVLRYENNTRREQKLILKDLGKYLAVELL